MVRRIASAPSVLPKRAAGRDADQCARVYSQVLGGAGGQEVESLARDDTLSVPVVALYASPPYHLVVPPLAVSRLSITLTASRVSGGLDGDRPRQWDSPRHSMFLTPAGATATWRKESPSRHLNIYFHAGAFAADLNEGADGGRPGDLSPLFNASMPGAGQLAQELVAELTTPGALAAEAADSLARLVLVRLMRRQRSAAQRAHPLTAQALARLREYVDAHLGGRILVGDLAAVVGLTPNRLAQLFVQHLGQTPHQFVREARLQRAVHLLQQSSLTLAEVAVHSGFASQQHLTHTMSRRLNITPARCRAAARPERSGTD